jgi:excisionase family DNA binding protein
MMARAALSIPEAARALGISAPAAYRLVARGRLPTVRLGPRLLRVPVATLERWLDAEATRPGAAPLHPPDPGSAA